MLPHRQCFCIDELGLAAAAGCLHELTLLFTILRACDIPDAVVWAMRARKLSECKALAPSVAWLAAEAWRAAGGCRYSTPALAAAMEQKALLLRFCCAEALHDAACCTQSHA